MIHHKLCQTCGFSADVTHCCEMVIAEKQEYIKSKFNITVNAGDWDKVREVIADMRIKAEYGIDKNRYDKLIAALPENQK